MKKILIAAFLLISCIYACQKADKIIPPAKVTGTENASKTKVNQSASMVNRGKYLVTVIGCTDCHSPKIMTEHGPIPDESRFLSGHPAGEKVKAYNPALVKDWALLNHGLTAAVGPWGVSFSSNLTSDETGIGNWDEKQFIRALREGKLKGLENGRPLLPPMPWESYKHLTDEDLKAIFAFLKTTKPIKNIVPPSIPPSGAPMQ